MANERSIEQQAWRISENLRAGAMPPAEQLEQLQKSIAAATTLTEAEKKQLAFLRHEIQDQQSRPSTAPIPDSAERMARLHALERRIEEQSISAQRQELLEGIMKGAGDVLRRGATLVTTSPLESVPSLTQDIVGSTVNTVNAVRNAPGTGPENLWRQLTGGTIGRWAGVLGIYVAYRLVRRGMTRVSTAASTAWSWLKTGMLWTGIFMGGYLVGKNAPAVQGWIKRYQAENKRIEAERKEKLEKQTKAKVEAEAKAETETKVKTRTEIEVKTKVETESKGKIETEAKAKEEAVKKAEAAEKAAEVAAKSLPEQIQSALNVWRSRSNLLRPETTVVVGNDRITFRGSSLLINNKPVTIEASKDNIDWHGVTLFTMRWNGNAIATNLRAGPPIFGETTDKELTSQDLANILRTYRERRVYTSQGPNEAGEQRYLRITFSY